MAGILATKPVTDGSGTLLPGGGRFFDVSGTGAGPWVPVSLLHDPNSGAVGTIRPGSSLPSASDTALVVTFRDSLPPGRAAAASSTPVAFSNEDLAAVSRAPNANNNGLTKTRVVAAATTNAVSAKASAGSIFKFKLFNVAAYNVFLKLYNKASAPTVGTDTPVRTVPIQAGGGYLDNDLLGEYFSTGIAWAITKLQADSDTTVLAAGDVTGEIEWI